MDINFYDRLIEVRKAFNQSGYSFAKTLGIPQPTYLRYEIGNQKPSARLIEALAIICGVNVHWLFTGKGSMFTDFEKNSGKRQYDTSVESRLEGFGQRLRNLQSRHNFLDREMAVLLKITESEYLEVVTNKQKPNLEVLNRLKENFKVDIDELLYGGMTSVEFLQ